MEENTNYEVSELICLVCHKRWIGMYPTATPLKELECSCGLKGYIIKTGQTIEDEEEN